MIDIARNIVPCSDKQDMKSRNGSYFQPSFSTRKRQRISSDLFSELPQKRSKTTNGRIWNKTTYSFSSQTLCTISSKVIRMWASFAIFDLLFPEGIVYHNFPVIDTNAIQTRLSRLWYGRSNLLQRPHTSSMFSPQRTSKVLLAVLAPP